MQPITVVTGYDGADRHTAEWAGGERSVDFVRDAARAARCTLSFAAVELRRYLARVVDADISFAARPRAKTLNLHLRVRDKASKADGFAFRPVADGLVIEGAGRTGALYGAYAFLKKQGFRWIAPGDTGEIIPPKRKKLLLPRRPENHAPSFPHGRGFVFECVSRESADIYLWMARNGLNASGYRPATGPLCEKLGMRPAIGGHIFETVLHVDRYLPSGKTVWEAHPEWFGLPPDGVRRRETAQTTQFCVTRPDLLDFLADEVISRLKTDWQAAERIDVWQFDTWGASCQCPDCQALGNGTDQALYFAGELRIRLNRAKESGTLERDFQLSLAAYEGTATLEAPSRPVPGALLAAGDFITYYPINRCYGHDFQDPACSWNRPYDEKLRAWHARPDTLPMVMGEYYNVSKFEDLPLIFTRRMSADWPHYHRIGIQGATYMHLPLINWGMRTFTQYLYALMTWDVRTDPAKAMAEYLELWYEDHAENMRRAYEEVEAAGQWIAQWRAWSAQSLLSQLLAWDGSRPTEALSGNDHLSGASLDKAGRLAVRSLENALEIVEQCLRREQNRPRQQSAPVTVRAVNPVELREMEKNAQKLEKRLAEDRRSLLYGRDSMTLLVEVIRYHRLLPKATPERLRRALPRLERLADRLDSYYLPLGYNNAAAGVESHDALSRSQLRGVIARFRALANP